MSIFWFYEFLLIFVLAIGLILNGVCLKNEIKLNLTWAKSVIVSIVELRKSTISSINGVSFLMLTSAAIDFQHWLSSWLLKRLTKSRVCILGLLCPKISKDTFDKLQILFVAIQTKSTAEKILNRIAKHLIKNIAGWKSMLQGFLNIFCIIS